MGAYRASSFTAIVLLSNSFYVHNQYGKDYEYEAPVKLLDKLLHEFRQSPDEQIVVVSQVMPHLKKQPWEAAGLLYWSRIWYSAFWFLKCFKVLVADINIGYEEIVNTQVGGTCFYKSWYHCFLIVCQTGLPLILSSCAYGVVAFLSCSRFLLSMASLLKIWRAWPAW